MQLSLRQLATGVAEWLRASPGLRLSTIYHLGLLALAALAMPFDRRLILGLNPWIKPMKFDLSVVIFMVTMGAILYGLEGRRRSKTAIGWGIGISMIVENTVISMQSMRGVPSHMNYTSLFNGVAFGLMGLFIVVNTVMVAWALVLLCLRGVRWPRAVTWGFRLGLAALLAGSVEGVLMVAHGGHTVGAADGGTGLPFVNWSKNYGDLRVAHFFALHALQAAPLLGWALARTRLTQRVQLGALTAGFSAYMGCVWFLFRQAMHHQPML